MSILQATFDKEHHSWYSFIVDNIKGDQIMKNDIEKILEDYKIDDSDGLSNDLQDYLKGQLEDAYNDLKDGIDNSLWNLKH